MCSFGKVGIKMKTRIHLVMPMAGGGSRFKKSGFQLPKPLLKLNGKPFFVWATESIIRFIDVEDITFVVLKEHIDQFEIDRVIKTYYPSAFIQIVSEILNGAVLSCQEGLKAISDDKPILFNDCDHAFVCSKFYSFCEDANFKDMDGAILTFASNSPNYSYVKFDSNKKVVGTVEKVVASDEAICGAYYFRNKSIFEEALKRYLTNCSYNEFFVSGVYNEMVSIGKVINTFKVDKHISFGTPAEYESALKDPFFLD